MKKLLTLAMVLSALLLTPMPAPAMTCTTTISAGDDIQAAIDSATPGNVICLAPGTYTPATTIQVDESVTIQGPQAGVDPRPSAGTTRTPGDASTEAIVDGGSSLATIFSIEADDVVIDGLEIANGTGDLITSPSTTAQDHPVVRYNIVHHSSGDEGVQLKMVTGALIEYNHVYDTAGDGMNIGYTSTGGTIYANEVHDIHSPDGAIYVYQTPNVTIQCNLVYDVYNNDGIKLGSKSGGDAALSGGSILYNTVHNTAQDGIAVYTSDTIVEGNKVYNSISENGAIYVAWGVSNITISLNDVHDNTLNTGKWGDPGAIMIGTAVNASTVSVHDNNIYGNWPSGATNKAGATLDATNNWWGTVDGPSGAGSGNGDAVSAGVDFDPWLDEPVAIPDPCVPDDQGPATSDVMADPNPVAVGGSVTLTAQVDDTGTGSASIASAEYSLDDETWAAMSASDGGFDSPVEGVTANLTAPPSAGIYNLCVRGTDAAGNTGPEECVMLVVYDPEGGFVTGGGWIDSPEGAYVPDPSLTGKATFGFVSKYKKGASVPEGNTEFQFQAGDLNFHSTSYEWLVVAGPRAKFKGTGTINGDGPYKFMLTALDADINESDGFDVDRFRIKIWYEVNDTESVIYDNGFGADDDDEDATTEIGGGSIVIHTKKK